MPAVQTATKSNTGNALKGVVIADIISAEKACETSQLAADVEISEMTRIFCSLSIVARIST